MTTQGLVFVKRDSGRASGSIRQPRREGPAAASSNTGSQALPNVARRRSVGDWSWRAYEERQFWRGAVRPDPPITVTQPQEWRRETAPVIRGPPAWRRNVGDRGVLSLDPPIWSGVGVVEGWGLGVVNGQQDFLVGGQEISTPVDRRVPCGRTADLLLVVG
jgi:hypothetical protein